MCSIPGPRFWAGSGDVVVFGVLVPVSGCPPPEEEEEEEGRRRSPLWANHPLADLPKRERGGAQPWEGGAVKYMRFLYRIRARSSLPLSRDLAHNEARVGGHNCSVQPEPLADCPARHGAAFLRGATRRALPGRGAAPPKQRLPFRPAAREPPLSGSAPLPPPPLRAGPAFWRLPRPAAFSPPPSLPTQPGSWHGRPRRRQTEQRLLARAQQPRRRRRRP